MEKQEVKGGSYNKVFGSFFYFFQTIISTLLRPRIGYGWDSNNSPIIFEIDGGTRNPLSPFKFNPMRAKVESFQNLVKECCDPFSIEGGEATGAHFDRNLN